MYFDTYGSVMTGVDWSSGYARQFAGTSTTRDASGPNVSDRQTAPNPGDVPVGGRDTLRGPSDRQRAPADCGDAIGHEHLAKRCGRDGAGASVEPRKYRPGHAVASRWLPAAVT